MAVDRSDRIECKASGNTICQHLVGKSRDFSAIVIAFHPIISFCLSVSLRVITCSSAASNPFTREKLAELSTHERGPTIGMM